jgi:hypothetical protein
LDIWDVVKISGTILGITGAMVGAIYTIDKRIKVVVDNIINNSEYLNKIAEKARRPIVIFNQNSSVLLDNGAMSFINKIEVITEIERGKDEPKEIIISPNRHLNVAPILESLDANYVITEQRGKKFDWVYDLGEVTESEFAPTAKQRDKIKRFRLEIVL